MRLELLKFLMLCAIWLMLWFAPERSGWIAELLLLIVCAYSGIELWQERRLVLARRRTRRELEATGATLYPYSHQRAGYRLIRARVPPARLAFRALLGDQAVWAIYFDRPMPDSDRRLVESFPEADVYELAEGSKPA
jgi:hypothetical protein